MSHNPFLELKNVQLKQQDNIILDNISLNINKGEFIYFVGKTGSGKSSLLKSLYGDISISNGDIYINDQALKQMRRKKILELRRKIGIIFQDFELLMDRSIEDNLRFVMKATGWKKKKVITDTIEELLNKVDMIDKAKSFPHLISGGEQQRVAIARALINKPKIILADEPSGNLDSRQSEEMFKLFHTLRNKYSTIFLIVTHNNTLANMCDRHITLEDGKILV